MIVAHVSCTGLAPDTRYQSPSRMSIAEITNPLRAHATPRKVWLRPVRVSWTTSPRQRTWGMDSRSESCPSKGTIKDGCCRGREGGGAERGFHAPSSFEDGLGFHRYTISLPNSSTGDVLPGSSDFGPSPAEHVQPLRSRSLSTNELVLLGRCPGGASRPRGSPFEGGLVSAVGSFVRLSTVDRRLSTGTPGFHPNRTRWIRVSKPIDPGSFPIEPPGQPHTLGNVVSRGSIQRSSLVQRGKERMALATAWPTGPRKETVSVRSGVSALSTPAFEAEPCRCRTDASAGHFGPAHWSIAIPPAQEEARWSTHRERKRPRLGSVPNPERSNDRRLASQPSDRTRRETTGALDGAMGSLEILQDTRGRTGTDGRFAPTHSAIAISRPAWMERVKRRPCMRNGRIENRCTTGVVPLSGTSACRRGLQQACLWLQHKTRRASEIVE